MALSLEIECQFRVHPANAHYEEYKEDEGNKGYKDHDTVPTILIFLAMLIIPVFLVLLLDEIRYNSRV